MTNKFTEQYYMDGVASGLSNYVDYSWKPEITLPCAHRMMQYLGARHGELVLDVGAARGFYVKALRMMGYEAYGYDISQWAVENCHPDVKRYMSTDFPKFFPDWVCLKDVMEHVPYDELVKVTEKLSSKTLKGALIIVPLVAESGGQYLRQEDEMDSTHVIRWTLLEWIHFLETHFPRFTLSASYHIPGIKLASEQVPHSTGFFKLTK